MRAAFLKSLFMTMGNVSVRPECITIQQSMTVKVAVKDNIIMEKVVRLVHHLTVSNVCKTSA